MLFLFQCSPFGVRNLAIHQQGQASITVIIKYFLGTDTRGILPEDALVASELFRRKSNKTAELGFELSAVGEGFSPSNHLLVSLLLTEHAVFLKYIVITGI